MSEWSGGTIPAGQRDESLFSAKLPPRESVLAWNAYQRYGDGSIVEWNRDPKDLPLKNEAGAPDFSGAGPWSQTRVVDDLRRPADRRTAAVGAWLGGAALLVALCALLLALRLKRELRQERAGAASENAARSRRRY